MTGTREKGPLQTWENLEPLIGLYTALRREPPNLEHVSC